MNKETFKKEGWILIPGYEELYAFRVSDEIKGGQVLAFAKTRPGFQGCTINIPEKIKYPTLDEDGYLRVSLCKNGIQKTFGMHQLSAIIFHPNPENKPQVNHKKGIKIDNRPSEVEWATPSENEQHAHRTGLKKQLKNKDNRLSHTIVQKTIEGKVIKEWPSLSEIERVLGFYKTNVSRVAKGEWSQAYGFIWHYL